MGTPQPKPKVKMGRPTKYYKGIIKEMIDYFNVEPHYETPVTITRKDGTVEEKVETFPSDLPTLAGFSAKNNLTRETLHDWATKKDKNGKLRYPSFSYAYKQCKAFQEHILVTNAMRGDYNASFAIFTAKNVLGWRDKLDTDITSGGDKIQPILGASAIINEIPSDNGNKETPETN